MHSKFYPLIMLLALLVSYPGGLDSLAYAHVNGMASGMAQRDPSAVPSSMSEEIHAAYLPVVFRPLGAIYGMVTLDEVPIEGVLVSMWINCLSRAGWDDSLVAQDFTDADGVYKFAGMDTVPWISQTGETHCGYYFLTYQNPSPTPSNGRLAYYRTAALTPYERGDILKFEDFDIADVELLSPGDPDMLTLPATFNWRPRPATPSDNYRFWLMEPACSCASCTYFESDPLGYAGSYTLESLPENFVARHEYDWYILICAPGGGCGKRYVRTVIFE